MINQLKKSHFEQTWENTPPGYALVPCRRQEFDGISELIYAPIKYDHSPISLSQNKIPSSEWTNKSFLEFVRGEFGSPSHIEESPPKPPNWDREITNVDIATEYLKQCESNFVYSGLVDAITQNCTNMSEKIFTIFGNALLGNKDNVKFLDKSYFFKSLEPLLKNQLRLRFLIPSFPFKDQCIFRTASPPSNVDLGEIAQIIHLHTLALALYQVHPYGADWIIVSDGYAYADMLRVDIDKVDEYQHQLKWFRNFLNLFGTVSIIDLKEMTTRLEREQEKTGLFEKTFEKIYNILKKSAHPNNMTIYKSFRVLVRGMKKNINLKDIINDIEWDDHWLILNAESKEDIRSDLKEIWETVDEITVEASFKYVAFNLAIRFLEIYQKLLPYSLRATIHSKKGQIAVPCLGSVYPWNGVGVLSSDNGNIIIKTMPLHSLVKKNTNVVECHLENKNSPFFYKIST